MEAGYTHMDADLKVVVSIEMGPSVLRHTYFRWGPKVPFLTRHRPSGRRPLRASDQPFPILATENELEGRLIIAPDQSGNGT